MNTFESLAGVWRLLGLLKVRAVPKGVGNFNVHASEGCDSQNRGVQTVIILVSEMSKDSPFSSQNG